MMQPTGLISEQVHAVHAQAFRLLAWEREAEILTGIICRLGIAVVPGGMENDTSHIRHT